MRHFLLVISIISMLMEAMSFGKMRLEYQWKYLDLLWESPQQKQEAINSGAYNASVAFFFDVDRAPDGRVFITAVRDEGIPVSVMTVTEIQGEGGPLLRPYPDWSWYRNGCKGITGGVFQIHIKCNHLFITDDGRLGYNQICLPQLLIFDLSTDKLVKHITIPLEIAHNKKLFGLLSSVLVYAPDCRDITNNAIVFMGDTEGAGLVVYNAHTSKLCRVESDFMKATNFSIIIGDQSYPFNDTIHSLTIINKNLYFAALAGNKIYKIQYMKLAECSEKDIDQANKQTQLAGALGGQTTALASDRCAIFFNDLTKSSILCVDTTKEINSKNKEVIASDPKQLQFVSGLKVINDELLVLSNRYHIHVSDLLHLHMFGYISTLNVNDINFRVLSMPINQIKKNTNCFSSCN